MKKYVWIMLASFTAGCASDVRDVRLDDVNFRDMQTVQQIRARLSPEDGTAFASYIVRHELGSANFCGRELFAPNGERPQTIGEAIDLARARDAAERIGTGPKHPRELAHREWDDLMSERDLLLDAQGVLREQHGPNAERQPEWDAIERKMSALEGRLVVLKPNVFGPD